MSVLFSNRRSLGRVAGGSGRWLGGVLSASYASRVLLNVTICEVINIQLSDQYVSHRRELQQQQQQ